MANRVYEHPYTVSNEARSMRSRLLDMKLFARTVLLDENTSSEDFSGCDMRCRRRPSPRSTSDTPA